jgi:NADH:ubiquinone oxidoreductase subunit 5 (subunit L)/multisubunit Na+/H+ antiporter MnhA subunit
MHKCKWIPLLLLGILSFVVGATWVSLIQDSINLVAKDPVQNLIIETIVAIMLSILVIFLIWFLAGCWNDKDHWFGKLVYCDMNNVNHNKKNKKI